MTCFIVNFHQRITMYSIIIFPRVQSNWVGGGCEAGVCCRSQRWCGHLQGKSPNVVIEYQDGRVRGQLSGRRPSNHIHQMPPLVLLGEEREGRERKNGFMMGSETQLVCLNCSKAPLASRIVLFRTFAHVRRHLMICDGWIKMF